VPKVFARTISVPATPTDGHNDGNEEDMPVEESATC